MSSPSIPISGSPHPKAHRLFVAVAILFVTIAAGFGAFWLCTFFGTADLRSVSLDRDAEWIVPADYGCECGIGCRNFQE